MNIADASALEQTIQLVGMADVQLPFFEHYFGLWAMDEERFCSMAAKLHGYDVKAHVLAVQSAGPIAPKAAAGDDDARPYQLSTDGIAMIPIRGMLMKQQSSLSSSTSTVRARRQVRAAAADPDVRAIVLAIESPGGTVAGTKELAADVAMAQTKKSVVAYIEDLGASAAYWIASQAGRIAANSMAMVGSIGTYGVVHDYSKYAENQGIKVHVIRAGAFKGSGEPGTPISAAEIAERQQLIDQVNQHFLDGVAAGRKKTIDAVKALADGRVHLAATALGLGLIDAVETFDETLAQLRSSFSKGRAPKMSAENTAPTAPVAATIDEIAAACPGADDSFVLSQLKSKATVAQATGAWMAALKSKNEELTAANKKLTEEKAAASQPSGKKPGVDPVANGKAPEQTGATSDDPIAAWDEAVSAHQAKHPNLAKSKVISAVIAAQPDLHSAYLAAHNAKHPPKSRAR